MKLLFDENLSYRLEFLLSDIYAGSQHVRTVGLLGANDTQIWRFAAENQFLLASKDTDFYDRSLAFGAPPKIIWLRIGNCTVNETAALLRSKYILLHKFAEDSMASFLVLQ